MPGSVFGRDLYGDAYLLKSNGEERTEGFDRLFDLFLNRLEGIDIHPCLFHSKLNPLRWMRETGLRIDGVP